ncbi:MAG: hypothetical protein K0U74_13185 [Alphaproteobacteria bacterium]|nr:hypothetical protein [Alphaproteobacteria bacterium]
MFHRLRFVLSLSLLVSGIVAVSHGASAADRWVRITQHSIDPSNREEIIDLKKARGSFVGFQFRARRGRISVERYTLNFHDGTKHDGGGAFTLRSGERSKVVARDDAERFPDSLIVTYPERSRRGRLGRLELWGLQSRSGRSARRPEKLMPVPPPPPRVGQVELSTPESILIAGRTAGREVKEETIEVADTLGKFKRLRLAARDSRVELERLTVEFDDSTSKEFAAKGKLLPETSTPWFDIDGSKFIKNVKLSFREPTSLTSPARIELYGTHADGWLAPQGEGGKFNEGWVLLGAQTAGYVGFDTDVIPVAEHSAGFSKIRLNVQNRAITLNQLRVKYESGEEDIVPVRARIDAGDTYGPISLRNGSAKLRQIEARYRSRVIDKAMQAKGAAVVQIWAKR